QPPSTHHPLTTGDGVFQVAMHLVMAQALVLPIVHATFGLGIDGAWWTLTWEAMYYGVLPAIARRFRRAPTAYTIGALVVATATRIVAFREASVMHHLPEAVQLFVRAMAEGIIGYGGHFAVGMLVAWTVARRAAPRRWAAFLLAAGGLAVTGAVWLWLGDLAARDHAVQPRWMAYFVGRPVLAVGFGAFLLGAAHLQRANALLGSRPLKWIGDRSYGVYLFHSIAIALLYNGVLHSQPTAAGLLRGLAVIVPIALVAGAVSYRWVEQPAIQWARRRETATDRARHRVEDAAAP
ncbi:MAG TPA: acyltransferase, partial [Acidimicrobiales bacterium]|nr:acyltransferase [Acidimicrobiales bacterium]